MVPSLGACWGLWLYGMKDTLSKASARPFVGCFWPCVVSLESESVSSMSESLASESDDFSLRIHRHSHLVNQTTPTYGLVYHAFTSFSWLLAIFRVYWNDQSMNFTNFLNFWRYFTSQLTSICTRTLREHVCHFFTFFVWTSHFLKAREAEKVPLLAH